MTSSSSDQRRKWSNLLTIILTLTTLGMLASTALLYWEQERSREALAVSVRTSGWVAYQAQLELVKSLSAIRVATIDPSEDAMSHVGLRLAILRSRLPLLYGSEEGRLLPNIQEYRGLLQKYEFLIDGYLDNTNLSPGGAEAVDVLDRLYDELSPLLQTLQTVLQSAIAYNEEERFSEVEASRPLTFSARFLRTPAARLRRSAWLSRAYRLTFCSLAPILPPYPDVGRTSPLRLLWPW